MQCSPVQAKQDILHIPHLPSECCPSDSSIGLLFWLFTKHHKAREISHMASYQLPSSASPYPSKTLPLSTT